MKIIREVNAYFSVGKNLNSVEFKLEFKMYAGFESVLGSRLSNKFPSRRYTFASRHEVVPDDLDDRKAFKLQCLIRRSSSDDVALNSIANSLVSQSASAFGASRNFCDVFLSLLIESSAQRRRCELLVGYLNSNLLALACSKTGSEMLSTVLGCVPCSKHLVGTVTQHFLPLATHPCGVRVLCAAMSRAYSQALGALETQVHENLILLLKNPHGRRVVQHVIEKEKSFGSLTHPQVPGYAEILMEVGNRSSLANLVVETETADILADIAILAPQSGFAQHALTHLSKQGLIAASDGTRHFVAAVILGLGLLFPAAP